ncbi:cohesin domain-containing protein [Methanolobus sp. ZRKC4]|uniref:cohesin domain-containing protein n=1 Tax=Methanolobus sp. ZRKC4 TaxID=3125787 RepID=UPI0032488416
MVTPGEDFTVDVFVTPDIAIAGLQFDLEFDSSKIQVDDVSKGKFLGSKGAATFVNYGNIDNNAGILSDIYGVVLGPSSILEPESFARITMSVKEQATSTSTISLKNVIISDPSGNSIDTLIKSTTLTIKEASSGPQEVFYDSFEQGDWNELWTEGRQSYWTNSVQRAIDGRYSAEIDGWAIDAPLTSKDIDLDGKTSATITFSWYIESGLDRGEYLAFDVSTDGGATWTEKATLRGYMDTENRWHYASVELNDINNLKLRFRGKMSNSREDAFVDMVRVVAT